MNQSIPATTMVLIAVFSFAHLLFTGCAAPEPFPLVSLADQLDPDDPPGPWRPAALPGIDPAWFAEAEGLAVVRDGVRRPATELADETPASIRALINRGALIQTEGLSTLSLPVKLLAGEQMVTRLRYPPQGKRAAERRSTWGVKVHFLREGEESLRTRLLRDGEEGSSRIDSLPGENLQQTVPVPEGGAERIEIVHRLEPGTPLRLLSVDILVVAAGEPVSEVERAAHFLRIGGDDASLFFRGAAVRRLVRVSRFGMTARCAVLTQGDSLEFDLPRSGAPCRLTFFSLRPIGEEAVDAGLSLECERNGAWTMVTSWSGENLPAGEWSPLTADLTGAPGEAGRIRLTHAGSEGSIGIAEPVLLPPVACAVESPNLVLVALDTLRADRLGGYGYRLRPTSERLDRTMENWGFALFRRAYSASPWTIPATAKFMASRYLDFHAGRQVPQSTIMLAEFLRDRGYYCAAFTGGGMVAVPGMEQGFHEFCWSSGFGKVEGSFPQAGQWLRQWNGGPFFLFVHTYETHRPYTRDTFCRGLPRGRLGDLSAGQSLFTSTANHQSPLTPEERTYVQAAYDSGVYHACEATADLLDILAETGRQRRTVVVILSDHGEELGDRHQLFGAHGHSLYQEMLDVPLLIHSPETAGRGLQVLEDPVSTVDLPPTAVDLMGMHWNSRADGVSLKPLLSGGEVSRRVPLLADLRLSRPHAQIPDQACVIEDGIKYIEPLVPGTPLGKGPLSGVVPPVVQALFRLSGDPGERRNLVDLDPALAARMQDLLRRAMVDALQPGDSTGVNGAAGDSPLTEELEEQLQALGYLAPTPRSPSSPAPDGN